MLRLYTRYATNTLVFASVLITLQIVNIQTVLIIHITCKIPFGVCQCFLTCLNASHIPIMQQKIVESLQNDFGDN